MTAGGAHSAGERAAHDQGGPGGAGAARVLLIGLEGADWQVLAPHMDAGHMPHLTLLVERGTSGKLASLDALGMLPPWATLVTGQAAHVHGVLSDEVPTADGQALRPCAAEDRTAPTLWDVARQHGVATLVVGWPDALGQDGKDAAAEAAHVATAAAVTAALPHSAWHPGVPASLRDAVRAAVAEDAPLVELLSAQANAAAAVVQQALAAAAAQPWRVGAVRLPGLGAVCQAFWRFEPPAAAGVLPRRAAAFHSVVRAACSAWDAWLGQLVALGSAGDTLIVASERGLDMQVHRLLQPSTSNSVPPGMVVMTGPDVPRDALAFGMAAVGIPRLVFQRAGLEWPGVASGAAGAHAALADAAPAPVRAVARQRAVAAAVSLFLAGELEGAAQLRLALLEADPGDHANASALLEILLALGRTAEAVQALASARRAVPTPPWQLELVAALVHAAAGDQPASQAALRAAAEAGAPPAQVAVATARVQAGAGHLAEATRSAHTALQHDSTLHAAHALVAQLLYAQEQYADAAQAARQAIGLQQTDPAMHLLLGSALAAAGQPRPALAALEEAVRQAPRMAAAYRRMAAIYMRQLGDVETAQRMMALAAASRAAQKNP